LRKTTKGKGINGKLLWKLEVLSLDWLILKGQEGPEQTPD